MKPEQLMALAPIIGVVVGLLVGIPYFRKGYRAAQERRKRRSEEKKDDAP